MTRDKYIHLAGKVQFLMSNQAVHEIANELESCKWVRGGTGVSGTGLPAERSRVRFPINLIHPVVLWSWVRLSLEQERIPGISPRGKSDRSDNLAIFSCRLSRILEASTS